MNRVALRVGLGAVAVVLGVSVYIATREEPTPGTEARAISEEEFAEARRIFESRRSSAEETTCERTALAELQPFEQAEFAAALEGLSDCFDLARDDDLTLFEAPRRGEDVWWGWQVDRGAGEYPEEEETYDYRIVFPPPAPEGEASARTREVDAACASLDEVLARVASSTGLCSPFTIVPNAPATQMPLSLARAAGVRARGRFESDPSSAFSILEHALIALQDMRRGATSMLVAMTTIAAEHYVVAHYVTLLFGELPLTSEAVLERVRAIEDIKNQSPPPRPLFEFDLLGFGDWIESTDPLERESLYFAASLPADTCGWDEPAHQCVRHWANPESGEFDPESLADEQMDSALMRSARDRRSLLLGVAASGNYATRLATEEVALTLLQDAIRLASARSGGCPPTAQLSTPRSADAAGRLVHIAGDQYYLYAPAIHGGSRNVLPPAYMFMCPPAIANWASAE